MLDDSIQSAPELSIAVERQNQENHRRSEQIQRPNISYDDPNPESESYSISASSRQMNRSGTFNINNIIDPELYARGAPYLPVDEEEINNPRPPNEFRRLAL